MSKDKQAVNAVENGQAEPEVMTTADTDYDTQSEQSLAVVNDDDLGGGSFIADLTTRRMVYSSMKPTTQEGKINLYNAMNAPAVRVSECINTTIMVQDVFVEVVNLIDQQSGELVPCPRIVLIDTEGVGYVAVSQGVFNALKKLIAIFGQPTWKNGLALKVKQIDLKGKRLFTLEAVIV